MASHELQHEIEQFLYSEARLLDQDDFDKWLELFTDDTKYWMPTRETRERGRDSARDKERLAIFEDDKNFLVMRVKRLHTGLAHAEQPPSRTRRFVSNIQITEEREDSITVRSNILVFQSRLEKSEAFFVGGREDILRKVNGTWRIANRKVILDHRLLPRSISILF